MYWFLLQLCPKYVLVLAPIIPQIYLGSCSNYALNMSWFLLQLCPKYVSVLAPKMPQICLGSCSNYAPNMFWFLLQLCPKYVLVLAPIIPQIYLGSCSNYALNMSWFLPQLWINRLPNCRENTNSIPNVWITFKCGMRHMSHIQYQWQIVFKFTIIS